MVTKQNTFSGILAGDPVTVANSDAGGDPFDDVQGAVTALAGGGMRADLVASTMSYVAWNVSGTSHFARAYFQTLPGATTHNARMVWNGVAASTTLGWDLRQIVSLERVGMATRNTTRKELGPDGGGAGTLARDTLYRAEAHWVEGNPGSFEGRLYDQVGDLKESYTYNGLIDPCTQLRFGLGNGVNVTSYMRYPLAIGYSDTDWLGEYIPPTPPTVDAGAPQVVEPFTLVTLDATAAPGTGGSVTVAWQQTGGPEVTLAGTDPATFTAPAAMGGAILEFTAVADDGSSTATDTTTVTVWPCNQWVARGGLLVPANVARA